MEQAWNHGGGAAFGHVFADDADFVDIRGEHHRGDDTIAHGHQAIFDTIYAGSTVRFDVEDAREIAAGVVVAIVRGTLGAPAGPLQGDNRSRMTMVIAKEEERRWSVRAFQNTLMRESA